MTLHNWTRKKFVVNSSMNDYIGRTLDAWKRCKDAVVVIEDNVVAYLILGKLIIVSQSDGDGDYG